VLWPRPLQWPVALTQGRHQGSSCVRSLQLSTRLGLCTRASYTSEVCTVCIALGAYTSIRARVHSDLLNPLSHPACMAEHNTFRFDLHIVLHVHITHAWGRAHQNTHPHATVFGAESCLSAHSLTHAAMADRPHILSTVNLACALHTLSMSTDSAFTPTDASLTLSCTHTLNHWCRMVSHGAHLQGCDARNSASHGATWAPTSRIDHASRKHIMRQLHQHQRCWRGHHSDLAR
jgi:hypothetical protein